MPRGQRLYLSCPHSTVMISNVQVFAGEMWGYMMSKLLDRSLALGLRHIPASHPIWLVCSVPSSPLGPGCQQLPARTCSQNPVRVCCPSHSAHPVLGTPRFKKAKVFARTEFLLFRVVSEAAGSGSPASWLARQSPRRPAELNQNRHWNNIPRWTWCP